MKKVLVWGLSNNRAGTERVIDTYCSALPGISFDFLCYEVPWNFRHLIESPENGYQIIPVKIKHPILNRRQLSKFATSNVGKYDELWFNANDCSNIDLLEYAANTMRIPRRIVHMHSSGMPNKFVTKFFSHANQQHLMEFGTDFWACSKAAGEFWFGDTAFRVIPNLVDSARFAFSDMNRRMIREYYGIGERDFLIGSVGRLAEEKNYSYLLRVFSSFLKRCGDCKLMIVGTGSELAQLKKLADNLGITDRTIFAGPHEDVERYYSAFDVAVFPSLYEGLGISILEAQFNGLPCVLSTGVPRDASITNVASFVGLDDPDAWVDALAAHSRADVSLTEAASNFKLDNRDRVAATLF